MAFRLFFWGDSTQNDDLVDFYTQNAEIEFRNSHKADFENMMSPQLVPDSSVASSSPNEILADNGTVNNAVVSELVQAVTENKDAATVANDISASINATTSTKDSATTLASAILNETAGLGNTTKSDAEKNEIILSVAETIQTVSKAVDEKVAQQNGLSSSAGSVDQLAASSQFNLLMNKMKTFLTDLRTKVLSMLKDIQKPQLHYYYGVEDTLSDAHRHETRALEAQKQRQTIEGNIKQKMADEENAKLFKNARIKLEKELKDQLIRKENQVELDKMLAKRMENARNRNLFENNFQSK